MNKTTSHTTSSKRHKKSLKSWISGAIVIDNEVPIIKVVSFLAFIGLIYIASNYHAVKTLRRINQLKTDLKELRYEYINAKSQFTDSTKQSRMVYRAWTLGLQPSTEPPVRIIISENDIKELKKLKQ